MLLSRSVTQDRSGEWELPNGHHDIPSVAARRCKLLRILLTIAIALLLAVAPIPSVSMTFDSDGSFLGAYASWTQAQAAPASSTASNATGSGSSSAAESSSANADSSESGSKASPKIVDVIIYRVDTDKKVGSAISPNTRTSTISDKGGTLEFRYVVKWDDGSKDYESSYLTWATSDNSIATVTNGGVVKAKKNGTVTLMATVDASHSKTGEALTAEAQIKVTGQDSAAYVSKIRITDENGDEFDGATATLKESLSTAKQQFYANVYVYDPDTNRTKVYSTKNGSLSSQVSGLSDITWSINDTTMGSVDEDTGAFRPAVYGTMVVTAVSAAGKDGDQVKNKVTVQVKDPDGGDVEEGYHPQKSMTIKVYYEKYPPADMDDDDAEEWVINQTYSVADMEALGCETSTYTAIGGGSYYTMTGTGPLLSTVLKDAGVNLSGVKSLSFKTADALDRPVSYAYIVGTDRFYYPNIDIGSTAGKVQVAPILALESSESRNASTEPSDDLSEATRFRLLFGSSSRTDHSSQYQIKWINTIYVMLKGGPDVKKGDSGDDSGSGSSGSGAADDGSNGSSSSGSASVSTSASSDSDADSSASAGSSSTSGGDSAVGQGSGDGGSSAGNTGSGTGIAGNAGTESGTSQGANDQQGAAGSTENQGESAASDGTGSDRADSSAGEESGQGAGGDAGAGGRFTVYQVLNNNDSDVQKTVDYSSPYTPFVLGGSATGALVLGACRSLRWYRRQTSATVLPE